MIKNILSDRKLNLKITIYEAICIFVGNHSFILSFYSCSSTKETIVNSLTGEQVAGYGDGCRYRIGKTHKSEIPQEVVDAYKRDSLYLVFNYASFGQESDKLLVPHPVDKP